MDKIKNKWLFSVFSLIILVSIWIITYFCIRNDYLLPSIWDTVLEMKTVLTDSAFYTALGNTILRTGISFFFSFILGLSLAVLSSVFPYAKTIQEPVISVIRTVPTMSVILILLFWISPKVAPVIVSSMVLFPVSYSMAYPLVAEIQKSYSDVIKVYRIPPMKKIRRIYFPLLLPGILEEGGTLFSMGLKIVISAEILSFTSKSLGGMMQEAKLYANMKTMFALTIFVILIGMIVELLFHQLANYARRWEL